MIKVLFVYKFKINKSFFTYKNVWNPIKKAWIEEYICLKYFILTICIIPAQYPVSPYKPKRKYKIGLKFA
jgi:hypothetical protein